MRLWVAVTRLAPERREAGDVCSLARRTRGVVSTDSPGIAGRYLWYG